ncbi:MAG: hypothetical protein KDI02_08990, partial [Anaerolineae bacterium]|nr:hypothetical protein [Anaerolineae bacterium]
PFFLALPDFFWFLPAAFLLAFTVFGSGAGMDSWAGVRPILNILVPHTGQTPLVPGVPLAV